MAFDLEVYLESSGTWIPYASSTLADAIAAPGIDPSTGVFNVNSSGMTSSEVDDLRPSTSWAVRFTTTSTDSLAASGTFIDYYSITLRNDCSDGILTQTSEV